MWRRTVALGSLLLSACSIFSGGKSEVPEGVIEVPAIKPSDASKAGCPQKLPTVSWQETLWKTKATADTSVWIDKECRCATASFSTWDSVQQALGEETTRRLRNLITSGGSFTSLTPEDRRALIQFSESFLWIPSPIDQQLGEEQFKQFRGNIVTPKKDEVDQLLPKLKDSAEAVAKQYPEIPLDLKFALVDGLPNPGTALPGGYIIVGRGFMRTAKPDELAFVLSHEVSHIARRHEVKAMQVKVVSLEQSYELFRTVAKTLGGGQQSPADLVGSAASIKQSISFLGTVALDYDTNLELEADSCAVPATMKAGFNPATGWNEYKVDFGSTTPSPSSHPPTEARQANLQKVMGSIRVSP